MASQTDSERYLANLSSKATQDNPLQQVISSAFEGHQRLAFASLCSAGTFHAQVSTLAQLIEESERASKSGPSVCIIENISPEFIGGLGVAWSLPLDFFIEHATNSYGPALWDDVMGDQARDRVWEPSSVAKDEARKKPLAHFHIEGIIEQVRHIEQPSGRYRFARRFEFSYNYGWQANTKMSYCRVSQNLCKRVRMSASVLD